MCVVFYSAYTFPNRKVKSGVGELREGSLESQYGRLIQIYNSERRCSGNKYSSIIQFIIRPS